MEQNGKDLFVKYIRLILNRLYENHFEKLCQEVKEYFKDEQVAMEIVNDTFLAFSDELTKTLSPSRVSYLLKSICRSRRKESLLRKEMEKERNYYRNGEYEREIGGEDWCLIVENAVARLPAKRKKIIRYLYYEGMTTGEIAKKMGLSPQTVLNQKNKALRSVKSIIQKEAEKLGL